MSEQMPVTWTRDVDGLDRTERVALAALAGILASPAAATQSPGTIIAAAWQYGLAFWAADPRKR